MIKSSEREDAAREWVSPQAAAENNIKNDFYQLSEEMEDRPMVMNDRTNAEVNNSYPTSNQYAPRGEARENHHK